MTAPTLMEHSSTVQRLQDLLGPCVLLACKGKRPLRKAWQKLTLEDMTSAYLEHLEANNVGVSLGLASQGLISLDFDTDEGLASFILKNPLLAGTLQTRGRRGGNLWIRIKGEIPASQKLVDVAGKPTGELRSTGNQTVIHGQHPDTGLPYQIVKQAHPLQVPLSAVVWPPEAHPHGWATAPPMKSPECDKEYIEDIEPKGEVEIQNDLATALCPSTRLYNTTKAIAALDAQREFENRYGPSVARLFERLVGRRYEGIKRGRNDFITNAVPFLYRALSAGTTILFSMQFYLRHQAIFNDLQDQHEKETIAMLQAVESTYLKELQDEERILYKHLPQRLQDCFRICRDLAANDSNKEFPPPLFFVTCQDMGDRVGVSCQQGSRLLASMVRLAMLEVHKQGTSHAMGERGKATVFRWLTPLPMA